MGIVKSKGPCNNSDFGKQVETRKIQVTRNITNFERAFKQKKKLKQFLLDEFKAAFSKLEGKNPKFDELTKLISKSKNKKIVSTFSLLHWKKDLLDIIAKEDDILLLIELEATQFSNTIFKKDQDNFFWTLIRNFDYIIANKYHTFLRKIFEKTCMNCNSKKIDFETMLRKMVNIEDREIIPLKMETDPDYEKALVVLREILDSVQCFGKFLSKIMHAFYSSTYDDKNEYKKIEDIFSMCVILNSLLRSKFTFYCYSLYLSKVLISNSKRIWFAKRQLLKSKMKAFDDLIYLNRFIVDEASQNVIRSFSVRYLRASSNSRNIENLEKMTPRGLHNLLKSSLFLDKDDSRRLDNRETNEKTTASIQMDIGEFLVHLNIHLKLNLDYIFSGSLREILKFFRKLEDFMKTTFGNTELEIKIDMMKLIIRMTNASLFVDKIFLLSVMQIKYLSYWQTFCLFTQVLLSELKSSGLKISKRMKKAITA